MGLAFWYGGKLLFQGEYSPTDFFLIFVAIIFGGQAAGFLFGFTLSQLRPSGYIHTISNLARYHESSRCC
jgi:ATP-binding cassette, subfamily B (MDR/TAP), member 1